MYSSRFSYFLPAVLSVVFILFSVSYPEQTESPAPYQAIQNELDSAVIALLKDFPGLKGSVKLRITVRYNGVVSNVETIKVRLNDSEAVSGIIEKAYNWKFSQFSDGKPSVTLIETVRFSSPIDSSGIFLVIMGAFIAAAAVLLVLKRTVG
jgi:hypothetical protein